jgi:plastocyanin
LASDRFSDVRSVPAWPEPGRRERRARNALAVLAALAVGLEPEMPLAARLEGRVALSPRAVPQQAALNPYPGQLGTMGCGTEHGAKSGANEARNVVLILEGVPANVPAPARSASPPQLAQRDQDFVPHVLAVPVGTTVDFPNFDPIFHNVFSYSKTKRFDLGKYGQGKSAQVRFDKPGVVQVFCDIHSDMTAFIYVSSTPWVVQPDAEGRFAVDGLPAGTYTVRLWHPERGTRTEQVAVTGETTSLVLQF